MLINLEENEVSNLLFTLRTAVENGKAAGNSQKTLLYIQTLADKIQKQSENKKDNKIIISKELAEIAIMTMEAEAKQTDSFTARGLEIAINEIKEQFK